MRGFRKRGAPPLQVIRGRSSGGWDPRIGRTDVAYTGGGTVELPIEGLDRRGSDARICYPTSFEPRVECENLLSDIVFAEGRMRESVIRHRSSRRSNARICYPRQPDLRFDPRHLGPEIVTSPTRPSALETRGLAIFDSTLGAGDDRRPPDRGPGLGMGSGKMRDKPRIVDWGGLVEEDGYVPCPPTRTDTPRGPRHPLPTQKGGLQPVSFWIAVRASGFTPMRRLARTRVGVYPTIQSSPPKKSSEATTTMTIRRRRIQRAASSDSTAKVAPSQAPVP